MGVTGFRGAATTQQRVIRGQIQTSLDGRSGPISTERFEKRYHKDGTQTIMGALDASRYGVLVHVVYTISADYRPLACYARHDVRGEVSEGWFTFSDSQIEGEARLAGMGRVSQRLTVSQHPRSVLAGLVTTDGLICAAFAENPTEGPFECYALMDNFFERDKFDRGPLVRPYSWDRIEELPRESLAGPGGEEVLARRFRWTWTRGPTPGPGSCVIWTSDDFVPLRLRADSMELTDVLVEVHTEIQEAGGQ